MTMSYEARAIKGSRQTANDGRLYITLKPWGQRREGVMQVIARLEQKMQPVAGIRLFLQPAQDVSVGGRLSRTQYRSTFQDVNSAELNQWAPRILDRLRALPQLSGVASDQQPRGPPRR